MIAIRKAEATDLTKVAALSELWAAEGITYGLAANTKELLHNFIGDYFWVAEVESQLVGYITGSVHVSEVLAVIEPGELYLEIDEVYVHPDCRSNQIGHLLVDKLLDTAEANGIHRSVVYSASKQWQRMVGFYERHGFKMWFVQMYR